MNKAEFVAALEAALKRKGFRRKDLIDAMPVGQATVYRWLNPREPDQPRGPNLRQLVQILEAPELAILDIGEHAFAILLEYSERVLVGKSAPEAIERLLPDIELTARERRLLANSAPGWRKRLKALAEGEWEELPTPERRRLLERMLQELRTEPESAGDG